MPVFLRTRFLFSRDNKPGRQQGFPALLAVILLLTGAISSCRTPANNSSGDSSASSQNLQTFTDGVGRKVTLRAAPQRIISLAPAVTEVLFALGLGERVIGVTSYCDFPAEAKTKEKVGDTLQPSLERIVALKPDLVVLTTASQLEKLTRQLDELHIPAFATNPRNIREVIVSIEELGAVTGTTKRAAEISAELNRRLSVIEERTRNLSKPRVLYALQAAPLITAGRNTFINDLITLAGGESISADEQTLYPQFSREAVIARAPDIIIIQDTHGEEKADETIVRRDFAVTPAIRNNRIVRVNPDLTARPGPRIIEGLEKLTADLHR